MLDVDFRASACTSLRLQQEIVSFAFQPKEPSERLCLVVSL